MMKRENEARIKDRILQREKLSELASTSFSKMSNKQKERLIEKNLQGNSMFAELGKNQDPLNERVKNRFNEKELLQKNYLVSNAKAGVNEYYEKYVE
jgi:hypothetical protein